MRPFRVDWTEERLAPLRDRIRAYRFPALPEKSGWDRGCDPAMLRELAAYWADGFDFAAAAERLNRLPQITVEIDGLPIHALHVVGEAGGTRPLLMIHGWPGSVFEFWHVIEPLAFPGRHGGRSEDAFDLVIPSLPGFGFSGKPRAPISPRGVAALFHELMRRLGYGRYRVQGGDWGAAVSTWAALDRPEAIEAVHLNYLLVQPDAEPETDEERAWRAAFDARQEALGAYSHLQATRPNALAYAMVDNPVAQLAWLVERFHDWADLRERSFETVFDREALLTNATIHILEDAFITATWIYAATRDEGVRRMPDGRRVEVPTAFTVYPDPRTAPPPQSWVERGYALERWRTMPRGGHFAAMEVPDDFVSDLRDWGRARR